MPEMEEKKSKMDDDSCDERNDEQTCVRSDKLSSSSVGKQSSLESLFQRQGNA